MRRIVAETEKLAYPYMKAFGFEESEVEPIVSKGLMELESTLERLEKLIASPSADDRKEMDDILHAMKGLLSQLGNQALSERVNELREEESIEHQCEVLRGLLY